MYQPTYQSACVLADNGGPISTILTGGAAVGQGDPALLPADLDSEGDTAEALPLDANGNSRVGGLLDIGAVKALETRSLVVTT